MSAIEIKNLVKTYKNGTKAVRGVDLTIAEGDFLFLYTDGLTEGLNPEGDMFGKSRALKLVQGSLSQTPAQTIQKIMQDFKSHQRDRSLNDDVTLVAARILRTVRSDELPSEPQPEAVSPAPA